MWGEHFAPRDQMGELRRGVAVFYTLRSPCGRIFPPDTYSLGGRSAPCVKLRFSSFEIVHFTLCTPPPRVPVEIYGAGCL